METNLLFTCAENIADIIPAALRELDQFAPWHFKQLEGDKKPRKIPNNPAAPQTWAKTNDPTTFGKFDLSLSLYERTRDRYKKFQGDDEIVVVPFNGIGFLLREENGLVGLDWDGCRDPETGEITQEILVEVLSMNSYAEISPSGTGIRCFVLGKLPWKAYKKDDHEMYQEKRFLTLTGHHLAGMPSDINANQEAIDTLHLKIFGPKPDEKRADQTVRPEVPGIADDNKLLDIARAAKNGDKFKRLYDDGDITGYGSDSEARLGLTSLLAFYCGPDPERIDRLFRMSKLMCEKWDSKRGDTTIGGMTIETALDGRTEFYKPPAASMTGFGDVNRTDLGMAKRLILAFRDDVRYLPTSKTWIHFDSTRWLRDDTGEVRRKAHKTIEMIFDEAMKMDDEDRDEWVKFALLSEGEARINAMINEARWLEGVAIMPTMLDADPYLLNVLNGTVDLRTGMLLPHDRNHLITKIAPVFYDAEAQCPRWLAFLERVQPEAETRDFLRRSAGYSLTGITTAQVFFFLYGRGQNGKSVFIEMLGELLGITDTGYWGKTKADTVMHIGKPQSGANNDLADLFGKRMISVSELEEGMRLNEGLIKDLTGDEAITARQLYEKNVTWKPTFKLWFYGNCKPEIRGTDGGIRRRPKMIPFKVIIPDDEKDDTLKEKLKAELSGILNWAIAGCLEYQRDGLGSARQVDEETEQFLTEMDVIGTFLDECCEKSATDLSASQFYEVYAAWAKSNNEFVKTNRKFGMSLTDRGYSKDRRTAGFFYLGVRLSAAGEKLARHYPDGSL